MPMTTEKRKNARTARAAAKRRVRLYLSRDPTAARARSARRGRTTGVRVRGKGRRAIGFPSHGRAFAAPSGDAEHERRRPCALSALVRSAILPRFSFIPAWPFLFPTHNGARRENRTKSTGARVLWTAVKIHTQKSVKKIANPTLAGSSGRAFGTSFLALLHTRGFSLSLSVCVCFPLACFCFSSFPFFLTSSKHIRKKREEKAAGDVLLLFCLVICGLWSCSSLPAIPLRVRPSFLVVVFSSLRGLVYRSRDSSPPPREDGVQATDQATLAM